MYQSRMFLGFTIDPTIAEQLNILDKGLKALLLGGGDYLEEYEHQGKRWLGKYVDDLDELPTLELAENNINSLRQRFLGSDPQNTQLWLLPTVQIESCNHD